MDEVVARKMAAQLVGKEIGGWKVSEYVGSGGTALVCEAKRNSQPRAIKIYDPAMVKQFGIEEVDERIKRQLSLVGKKHENLVGIYDGGYCENSKYFYVVMEIINAKNLGEIIDKLPRERIGPLIAQVASAALFLEEMELVHRDIKPDNIAVTDDFSQAVLLDLGVIRPVGEGNFTNGTDTLPFLGTARYSSPEYLLRKEEDNIEGWRALTFYQLGAVLHDMIMKYPIFKEESEPYARLVQAVQHDIPTIYAKYIDMEIIHLAKKCLLKEPKHRVKCIRWDEFKFPKEESIWLEKAKSRIKNRRHIVAPSLIDIVESQDEIQRKVDQVIHDVNEFLAQTIREICITSNDFPALTLEHLNALEPSSFILKVSYCPSKKHALNKRLTVIMNVNLLDVNTQMIQLGCAAELSTDYKCSQPPDVMMDIFEGPFDKEIIRVRMNEILHLILDKAQAACESSELSEVVGDEGAANIWLTLPFNEGKEGK